MYDTSLLSEQAQELLDRVELEGAKVGLRLDANKTEIITENIGPELPTVEVLCWVMDFKSLGSWVNSTDEVGKVLACLEGSE